MSETSLQRLPTGIEGFDEITNGGFIRNRSYLVRGGPGSGKSTIGLHFLSMGVAAGEKSLFITLEESAERIRQNALLRGIDITGVEVLDISPSSDFFAEVEAYDIFSPDEVERAPLTAMIVDRIKAIKPTRVFLDPMTQFRYLSPDTFQYRKQALSFIRFLAEQGCTTLYTSENNQTQPDDDLQFMSDGVFDIETGRGGAHRTIAITKFRGSDFRSGVHTMKLTRGGVEVFPRLMPIEQSADFTFEKIGSGIPDLDELLEGGIERGTVTILTGPSGVGKTTLGMQFMKEAAGRGERSVIYSFEEEANLILKRCDGIGIPARAMAERGSLQIRKIEPLQYTQDEFARIVRDDVENNGTRIVMLDSTAGFALSMRENELQSRMHALTKYLQNSGVAVIIVNEVNSVTGDFQITEAGISYLADNVIFLRFLEIRGEMRKAIGVLKKRLGNFEKSLREYEITGYGIKVGKPLSNLRGILSGTPQFEVDRP
jgi:circadian clock protein KaiC